MIEGMYIADRILEHQRVYENAGINPPPYRITCKENKELVEYCKPLLQGDEKIKSMISMYHGIQLEVVMIVDAYL